MSDLTSLKKLNPATYLLLANLFVNAGNYGLNIILGRYLGPEGFSEANLLATIVMILSFVGMGLQLSVAKFSAEFKAVETKEKIQDFIFTINSKVKQLAIFVVLALVLISPVLKIYFQLESSFPLIILWIGVPYYFLLSISRGFLQGSEDFKSLANTYLVEMILRLIVTISLIIVTAQFSLATESIALGFLLSFIVSHLKFQVKAKKKVGADKISINAWITFLAIVCFYELSQILINNSDVLLVKHYFNTSEAGLYASLALLGRAVFFATWIVVTILFPKVIDRQKRGLEHKSLFWKALGLVGLLGLSATIFCFLFNEWIIEIAFGSEYTAAASLLWKYAASTSLFACANVFVYYNLSLQKYTPVLLSILAGVSQIVLINNFHSSLEMVIQVQLILMAILFASMLVYQKCNPFFIFHFSRTSLNNSKLN